MKNKILTYLFIVFILGFMIVNIITPNKELSYSERRKLKVLPEINIRNIFNGEITSNLESYLTDHFVLRDEFRSLKTLVNLNILNKKDNNNLYYENNHIFKIEYPLKENKVLQFTNKINNIYNKYLINNNVYYSIIPDKNYYSSNNYLKMDYDKLISIVNTNLNNMKYIDITKSLTLNDYYLTDIHWKQENLSNVINTISREMDFETMEKYKENYYEPFYGSYYGQLGLNVKPDKITYLTNDIIDNTIVKDNDSDLNTVYEIESLGKMDSYDVFLSGPSSIIEMESNNTNSTKELIIFRDSFGSSIAPLFLNGYKKVTLVDIRYVTTDLLSQFINFTNQDVLFLYNTSIINNSDMLK